MGTCPSCPTPAPAKFKPVACPLLKLEEREFMELGLEMEEGLEEEEVLEG